MLLRIAWFEAEVRMRAQCPASTWITVARNLGYYELLHLFHEFPLLAGQTLNADDLA
jgi:hypothetical protein